MIISARGGKSLDGDPYLLPKKKTSEKLIKIGLEKVKMEIPPSQNNWGFFFVRTKKN